MLFAKNYGNMKSAVLYAPFERIGDIPDGVSAEELCDLLQEAVNADDRAENDRKHRDYDDENTDVNKNVSKLSTLLSLLRTGANTNQ